MHPSLLHDIGVAVLAATVLGLIAHWLKQPIILGYLIAGAIVGPKLGRGWVQEESIETISEIGLILLLFIIGLEMNLKALLSSGRQLLITGFGQFLLCAAIGAPVFLLMGYGFKGTSSDGLYLALMCALSSTAVVVKLLYDKGELDTLSGRMTLGVLVIQDIYAIFILAFQPRFANPEAWPVIKAILGTFALVAAGFMFSKHVLRWTFASIAKAPEMVVAVSIGWCAAVAAAAGAMGLSKEMGALVAGLCISAFPYSIHVTAKTLPLRDFFLTLFFMSLGMKIVAPQWSMVPTVIAMIAVCIVTRFLSVYPLLNVSGAGRRTAFIASLNLAQISEFSLVIASLGVFHHHIAERTVSLTIYAMAITAVMSSYAIRFNHELFQVFDRLMKKLGRDATKEFAEAGGHEAHPVAILGFHRTARALVDVLAEKRPDLLPKLHVVDFNTETLRELRMRGVYATFGDISSHDTLEHAHLRHTDLILCTIPDMLLKGTDNQTLVKTCRSIAKHAKIVATADDAHHERRLRVEGADAVIQPHDAVAAQLGTMLAAAYVLEATGETTAEGISTPAEGTPTA